MTVPDRLPGGLPVRDFLREYWQKKPLLLRNAFPDFDSPVTPEELAGLSLEEDVASRLILEHGGEYPWQLRHGPFEEEDFLDLPASHWTLLVQEVDRWVPGVAELLDRFLFVPAWRLDDVMVSYATDGGSVGAHVDNYDVFLIQALGRREWHIGPEPAGKVTLVPDLDVSMLADFEPDQVMTLERGDMLYLPPRVPHHGIAMGEGMTYSVGFRAPGHDDLVAAVLTHVLDETDPLARYSDPDLEPADHPGRIGPEVLKKVHRIIRDELSEERIARGFGALVTRPKRGDAALPAAKDWSPAAIAAAVEAGAELVRQDPNRFAYIEDAGGGVSVFVHGEAFELPAEAASAAPLIAGRRPLDAASLSGILDQPDVEALLARLVRDGHLEVVEAA